jgi:hypothetical protein
MACKKFYDKVAFKYWRRVDEPFDDRVNNQVTLNKIQDFNNMLDAERDAYLEEVEKLLDTLQDKREKEETRLKEAAQKTNDQQKTSKDAPTLSPLLERLEEEEESIREARDRTLYTIEAKRNISPQKNPEFYPKGQMKRISFGHRHTVKDRKTGDIFLEGKKKNWRENNSHYYPIGFDPTKKTLEEKMQEAALDAKLNDGNVVFENDYEAEARAPSPPNSYPPGADNVAADPKPEAKAEKSGESWRPEAAPE